MLLLRIKVLQSLKKLSLTENSWKFDEKFLKNEPKQLTTLNVHCISFRVKLNKQKTFIKFQKQKYDRT